MATALNSNFGGEFGRVLHKRTPTAPELPSCYLRFAEKLRPRDAVVTFNYDRVLELALDYVGLPYRRFPNRYLEVGPNSRIVDSQSESNEVTLLKMHGSIDWISIESFREQREWYQAAWDEDTVRSIEQKDLVFGAAPITPTLSLTEGPMPPGDPLNDIYVVQDLSAYYAHPNVLYFHPPLILAPSQAKQLYGKPLREFWSGLGLFAWVWEGLTVIGYSLPPADGYAQQVLYQLVQGYTAGLEDRGYRLGPMRRLEVVDLRTTDKSIRSLRKSYRFMKSRFTDFIVSGFDDQAVARLFRPTWAVAEAGERAGPTQS